MRQFVASWNIMLQFNLVVLARNWPEIITDIYQLLRAGNKMIRA